jgi:hypothetical protein
VHHHHEVAAAGDGDGGDEREGSNDGGSNFHDVLLCEAALRGRRGVPTAMSQGSGQAGAGY